MMVRIPISIIGYHCNLGLVPFAIASCLDFGLRGI